MVTGKATSKTKKKQQVCRRISIWKQNINGYNLNEWINEWRLWFRFFFSSSSKLQAFLLLFLRIDNVVVVVQWRNQQHIHQTFLEWIDDQKKNEDVEEKLFVAVVFVNYFDESKRNLFLLKKINSIYLMYHELYFSVKLSVVFVLVLQLLLLLQLFFCFFLLRMPSIMIIENWRLFIDQRNDICV